MTILLKYVWTLLKEWNIYHHFVVFTVTLLPEIACKISIATALNIMAT